MLQECYLLIKKKIPNSLRSHLVATKYIEALNISIKFSLKNQNFQIGEVLLSIFISFR